MVAPRNAVILLFVVLSIVAEPAFSRGSRKVASLTTVYDNSLCQNQGIDCSSTCCLGTSCASSRTECTEEEHESLSALAIGIIVIASIAVGLPILVKTCNCLINKRFFKKTNESTQQEYGGMSVCEILGKCLSCRCCYSAQTAPEGRYKPSEQDLEARSGRSCCCCFGRRPRVAFVNEREKHGFTEESKRVDFTRDSN